jgi:hypothetical protein
MFQENTELSPGFTPVSDGSFDALDEYVNLLIEKPEEAQTKQAEILGKVPEEEREELSGLMETAASLISAVRSGEFPSAKQIEEAIQKNKP